MAQPLPLDEAIEALKRDPAHPVFVKVDEELTVEVRAVGLSGAPRKSAADAFREVGRWEGETGAELDALFADVRQRSLRPALKYVENLSMLPLGVAIVRRYAVVRAEVERRGRSKRFRPDDRVYGSEHGATLVTHDTALKDGAIAGLVFED